MSRVIDVDASMLDEVYSLVSAFDNPQTTRAMWARALAPPFALEGAPSGFALQQDGRLVGFVGALHTERRIAGRTERFCNLHSLILAPDYRGQGTAMILRCLRVRNATLTALTPVRNVNQLLRRVGFQTLDKRLQVLPALGQSTGRRSGSPSDLVVHDPQLIRPELSDEAARRMDDHADTGCRHLLIDGLGRRCHVMYTTIEARVPYNFVLHISDPELFSQLSVPVRQAMMDRSSTRFVAVDVRLLQGHRPSRSFELPVDVRRLYRGDGLDPHEVDNLYSEFAMLNVAGIPSAREELRQLVGPTIQRYRRGDQRPDEQARRSPAAS